MGYLCGSAVVKFKTYQMTNGRDETQMMEKKMPPKCLNGIDVDVKVGRRDVMSMET